MRSALVSALLAAASAASSPTPTALPPNPTGVDCDTCQFIVDFAAEVAGNATTLAGLVAALDGACATVFNASVAADCEAVVDVLAEALPWLQKNLATLAWTPLAVCAAVVDACFLPCCEAPTSPEQLVLSPTRDPTAMSITWATLNATATSTVQFGPAGGNLSQSASGAAHTYTQGGWLGLLHVCVMTGLTPGGSYSYRVGDPAGGWSFAYTFRLPGLTDGAPGGRPLRIAQTGDMAYDAASDGTVAALEALAVAGDIDLWLHAGDGSYADGFESHFDAWQRKISGITARVPTLVNPGNHEFWWNFAAYRARFAAMPVLPNVTAAGDMYYSLDVGGVHIAALNTETDIDTADLSPAQVAWLDADLAAADANRAAVPFVVVTGHRPFYCSNDDATQCGTFAAILRLLGEGVLAARRADLVITAHEHGWERNWPVYNGTIVQRNYSAPAAPVYIVNGAAGNREGNQLPGCGPATPCAAASGAIGYALLNVSAPALTMTFLASADGSALDTFTLTQGPR